jgi:hypothetical protein
VIGFFLGTGITLSFLENDPLVPKERFMPGVSSQIALFGKAPVYTTLGTVSWFFRTTLFFPI